MAPIDSTQETEHVLSIKYLCAEPPVPAISPDPSDAAARGKQIYKNVRNFNLEWE